MRTPQLYLYDARVQLLTPDGTPRVFPLAHQATVAAEGSLPTLARYTADEFPFTCRARNAREAANELHVQLLPYVRACLGAREDGRLNTIYYLTGRLVGDQTGYAQMSVSNHLLLGATKDEALGYIAASLSYSLCGELAERILPRGDRP
jgi:hypothetical protein